jgi:DNA-binding winged helix-turn-helix (wHTH) protein
VTDKSRAALLRFGTFELDLEAEQLLKNGRLVHLQPQPFKLLCLLTSQTGKLVTREEIRAALWKDDTFVDFEQGLNFAIKQVREALSDQAEHPVYIQTIPKRGTSFWFRSRQSQPESNSTSRRPSIRSSTKRSGQTSRSSGSPRSAVTDDRKSWQHRWLSLPWPSCWCRSPGRAGDWSRR